jgi:hypothetical protein
MTEATTSSPAAVRARKHRERRRSGARCVTVQLWPWGVDQLVALGYLQSTERNDLEAIKVAASEFFSGALFVLGWKRLRLAREIALPQSSKAEISSIGVNYGVAI